MPIDIENLNPSTRFPYPLPEANTPSKKKSSKDEWVSIRILSATKIREIDKETTVKKSEFAQPRKPNGKIDKRAALQRIEWNEVTDQDLRNRLMWDEIIDEIHIHDAKGKLITSDTDMKVLLMSNDSDFAIYISDCIEILTEDEKDQKKVLEKNSMSSQKG